MKKKIKEKLIKYELVLVFIFIFITICTFSFNVSIECNDELWNFSNIYKMTNGETIYKDLNVIITPLFFYVGKIVFQILGSNYLTLRMYNVVIWIIFYFLIYKIFQKLKIERNRRIFYTIIIMILTYRLIITGANYNALAIDFCLLGILLILGEKDNWIQGFIIFLIFMTKQNIGIYYGIGFAIYHLVKNKKIIEAIKKTLPAFLITIGMIGIYCVYLFINQNLYDFINYTFLGIGEFGIKNIAYDNTIYSLLIAILANILMIWTITSKKLEIKQDIKKQVATLISFAIPSLLISYPIINEYHVIIAIIPTIIAFFYSIEKSFLEEIADSKKVKNTINIISTIYIISIIGLNLYFNSNYFFMIKNYNYYDVYKGSFIDKETKNNINNIIQYIKQSETKGYKVKILSYKSNLYMNILKRNNKNMDLPFYGNLGKEGEDGLIKEIKTLKNTNLLISKEDNNYQESEKVKEYVLNNYEKIGEIEEFFIYKVGY